MASVLELLVVLGFGAITASSRIANAEVLPKSMQVEIGILVQLLTGGGAYEMNYTACKNF